jgi:hypothetical protein
MERKEFDKVMDFLQSTCRFVIKKNERDAYFTVLGYLPLYAFQSASRQVLDQKFFNFPAIGQLRQLALQVIARAERIKEHEDAVAKYKKWRQDSDRDAPTVAKLARSFVEQVGLMPVEPVQKRPPEKYTPKDMGKTAEYEDKEPPF